MLLDKSTCIIVRKGRRSKDHTSLSTVIIQNLLSIGIEIKQRTVNISYIDDNLHIIHNCMNFHMF